MLRHIYNNCHPKKIKEYNKEHMKKEKLICEEIVININTLSKNECSKYLTDKYILVSVDLEKLCIIINKMVIFYKYIACRRRSETYTKRCNEIINMVIFMSYFIFF